MITISLNMKFWHDGFEDSTRLRNVIFCWDKLKDLNQYLLKHNICSVVNLYDFSEYRFMSEAKHISYPVGTYKKSEKTNIILKDQSDYQFFMMVDSDAFFDEEDFEKCLNLISLLKAGDVITFDLAKLEDNINQYLINNKFYKNKANWSYAYSGDKHNGPLNGHMGGLGGVYICDTNLLLNLGGFDEKYIGWGGEDGDMLSRIMYSPIYSSITPIRSFAPYHLPHFADWGSSLYGRRFA